MIIQDIPAKNLDLPQYQNVYAKRKGWGFGSVLGAILLFLLTIIGGIIFIVWKNKSDRAKNLLVDKHNEKVLNNENGKYAPNNEKGNAGAENELDEKEDQKDQPILHNANKKEDIKEQEEQTNSQEKKLKFDKQKKSSKNDPPKYNLSKKKKQSSLEKK